MENKVDNLLNQLKDVRLPVDLNNRVLAAVRREKKKQQIFMVFWLTSLAVALVATVLSLRLFIIDANQSSLSELLKLALTDSREIFKSMGTWVLAVIEALPTGSLVLTLGMFFLTATLINHILSSWNPRNHQARGA